MLNDAVERSPVGELVDIMDVGFACAYLVNALWPTPHWTDHVCRRRRQHHGLKDNKEIKTFKLLSLLSISPYLFP
jgi:hypothetical protein